MAGLNNVEYIEMKGCEELLAKIKCGKTDMPWDSKQQENMEIVREFLEYRYNNFVKRRDESYK